MWFIFYAGEHNYKHVNLVDTELCHDLVHTVEISCIEISDVTCTEPLPVDDAQLAGGRPIPQRAPFRFAVWSDFAGEGQTRKVAVLKQLRPATDFDRNDRVGHEVLAEGNERRIAAPLHLHPGLQVFQEFAARRQTQCGRGLDGTSVGDGLDGGWNARVSDADQSSLFAGRGSSSSGRGITLRLSSR